MDRDVDRYTRQRRLREIGDAGQQRIEAGAVTIAGGAGAMLELVYLHRAGVGRVSVDALANPAPFPHAEHFRHPVARRHAAASFRALRTVLELAFASAARGATA